MQSNRRRWLVIMVVLLLAATTTAFFPCVQNGWTNWDDGDYVVSNPDIQGLTPSHLAKMFSSVYVSTYLPLTMLSFAVNYAIGGTDPFLYHAINLLLHLCNTLLVFWFIRRLSGNDVVAAATALLFGIHPLHVESVAWISARKDVLSTLFFLLSLLWYDRWAEANRIENRPHSFRHWPWLSLLFFLCSLLSKAITVMLPAILLLMDYYRGRNLFAPHPGVFGMSRPVNRRFLVELWSGIWHLIPYTVLAGVILTIGVAAQHSGHSLRLLQSPLDNFLIASHGVLFYITKAVVPVGLSFLYPYPAGTGWRLPLEYLGAPAILAVAAYVVFRWFRSNHVVVFSVLFFLITLAPVSQLIPMGSAVAADRYTYIPLIGVFFIGCTILNALQERLQRATRFGLLLFRISLLAVLISYGTASWYQSKTWKNNQTLLENYHSAKRTAPIVSPCPKDPPEKGENTRGGC